MASDDKKNESLRKAALDYHSFPAPGKLEIKPTKPLANQRDLSRAYSPGVAEACVEIKKEMSAAYKYTSKSNLVAVISNGTAVLGLGNGEMPQSLLWKVRWYCSKNLQYRLF